MASERPSGPVGKLTAQAWLHVVLASLLFVVALAALAVAQVVAETTEVTDRLVASALPAQNEAIRLQNALISQETGIRGYAITGDPRFLQPYYDGRLEEGRAAQRLRELVGDRPVAIADLAAVEQAAAGWRGSYAEPLVSAGSAAAVRDLGDVTAAQGKDIFDQLRDRFTTQEEHLNEMAATDSAALARTRTVRNAILGVMIGVCLLTGIAMIVLVRRLIVRPMRELTDSSQRVAGGDFAHRIDARGPADVAAVATAVDDMRRRILAELESSREQQARVEEQRAFLDSQTLELRRSNAELEQFAYVASHDLQEPLRKVASFCQLIEKRYGSQLDERGKQYIHYAVDGAKRMQVLINDLLAFSRVGRVITSTEPIGLDDPLDRALANLSAAIEESGARVVRPDRLPELVGEPVLLTMLWQNLIGNAIKFRAADRAPVVEITCVADADGGWSFTVTDNGIGIEPEFADKVFVIFQRLHPRGEYGGTGIGLAICKKIVEYHGGHIGIDTDYTGGTRFRFTLVAAVESTVDRPITAEEGVSP
ncbi:CHASE3 domain-containing protein [Nocardia sp. CC201C]|uniref:sensor histidine kinase n=1 Tax=Nocardia sp. CC201C TaxID=3044575 RepID=UPI0024A7AECA|nr:CHASE3 domain-containing protein [Nocardia sp. CC201C]